MTCSLSGGVRASWPRFRDVSFFVCTPSMRIAKAQAPTLRHQRNR